MTQIAIKLGLGDGYNTELGFVTIPAGSHTFNFTPQAGKHRFESEPTPIGTLAKVGGRRLMARISFGYEYDAENQIIRVSGPDHASGQTMHLATFPEGTDEVCWQRIAGHGFRHDDLASNPHWNYLGPLTPGLEAYFANVLHAAIEDLITALKSAPGLSVEVRGPAPELPLDDYLKLVVVKHEGHFLEYFNAAKTYPEGCSYIGVESTYAGTFTFAANGNFANVIGSTNDPKVPGYPSWIGLWSATCNHGNGPNGICASTGFPANFGCNAPIYGGHVISGIQALAMNQGDRVYIIPICNAHNNNDQIHMEAINWQNAVALNYW